MHADGPLARLGDSQLDRRFVPRAVAGIAAEQHGLVTVGQLAAVGVSGSVARSWAAKGWLHREHRGVYAVGYPGRTRQARWMAAVLACGTDASLSHRSCGALLGFRQDWAGGVDVTVPGRGGKVRHGIAVHRADLLLPGEISSVAGIPCTTAARTLVDLATVLRPGQVEYAIHAAQAKRLVTRAEIAAVVAHLPGRRGVGVIRQILRLTDESEDTARSRNERRFRRIVRRAGMQQPAGNYWVVLDGWPAGGIEVDFAWPDRRLAVEVDSALYHETERARINDPARDRALMLAGWRVIRFSDRDLIERPEAVARQMLALY